MYYVVSISQNKTTIQESFADFDAAKEYVMMQYLTYWCIRNDFVTKEWTDWWLVNIPIGYEKCDNLYSIPYIHQDIINKDQLQWLPTNKTYQEYRSIFMLWMRQSKRLTSR